MKKILLLIVMTVGMAVCHAQLGAPKITVRDTFYVTKILYNEMELAPQDWPGRLIIEDPARIDIFGNVYQKNNVERRTSIYCKHKQASEQYHMNVVCKGKYETLNKEILTGSRDYCVFVIGNYDIFVMSNKMNVRSNSKSNPYSEKPKDPEINTESLYNQSNSAKKNYYDGDTYSSRYDGTPGKGGTGYSLTGRSAKALPTPIGNTHKQGKVVVKIWVDRNGNVTQTSAPEKGSTISDPALVNQAKTAAMKAIFSAKADAPEMQTGTITYVFATN
ncbi:MAG: energy transducer TonB [Bacteroidales bacterium]|nr:energy transducer TonB [Candidatus Colimorpha merdihippi]